MNAFRADFAAASTFARLGVATSVVIAWLALASLPSEAAMNDSRECVTPRTMAEVKPSGKSYELVLIVENPSDQPMEFTEFYFGENMLQLYAVPAGESKGLAHIVPLLSPGPRPLTIAPLAKIERTYQLSASFPELEKKLENKDVLISWELTLAGDKLCFSQELASSAWLRKRPEK